MIKKEGFWSFYRGVIYTLPLNLLVGIFFSLHEKIKKDLKKLKMLKNNPHFVSILSTSVLGFGFSFVLNPFYTIKVWLLLDINKFDKKLNFLQACKKIKRIYGFKGFYKGFFSTYLLSFNKSFGIFLNDFFKFEYEKFYSTNFGNFFLGGAAKLISSTITYPLSTIRTRIQQNQEFIGLDQSFKYSNILNCSRLTFKNEGFKGFFNGYSAYAPKTFFSSGFLFIIYENLYSFLENRK